MARISCPTCRAIFEVEAATGGAIACARCGQSIEVRPTSITSPGRWVSPGFAAFSLAMFFLPWVNLSCSSGAMAGKVVATQSGSQAVYGGLTVVPVDEAPNQNAVKLAVESRDHLSSALLAAYPLLLAAVVLTAALPLAWPRRRSIRLLLSSAALAVVIVQAVRGLPLEQEMGQAGKSAGADKAGLGGLPKTPAVDLSGLAKGMGFEVSHTPWFWVCLLANAGAVGTAAVRKW
jgi:hypothetical protein